MGDGEGVDEGVVCDAVLACAGEAVVDGFGGGGDAPGLQVPSCHRAGKSEFVHWHWLLSLLSKHIGTHRAIGR